MIENAQKIESRRCSGNRSSIGVGLGVALGVGIGTALGSATGQWWWIGVFVGMGVALGAGIGSIRKKTRDSGAPQD